MNRVTYLLGAGASYYALPTINNMGDEVKNIIGHLTIDYNKFDRENNVTASEPIRYAIYDLRLLESACAEYASIDTYARMLFLNRREEDYRRFKNTIILFFELYYYYNRKIDKRYDSFLAYHMQREKPRLPQHVNIISWNYDYEFEKAFSKYYGLDKALEEIYQELTVHHKGLHKQEPDFENLVLIKLNGTVGYKYLDGTALLGICNYYYKSEVDKELNYKIVCPTISKHTTLSRQYEPLISFAWESEESTNNTLNKAIETMTNSSILVVIGYSFPDFNREFDSLLLNENATRLIRKIYVQDLEPHKIIDRMREYRMLWHDVEFIAVPDTSKFYIPHQHTYNTSRFT